MDSACWTGRMVSNLSLTEVEYSNTNQLPPTQLLAMVQTWGASDVLVVSHAYLLHGKEAKVASHFVPSACSPHYL